MVGLTGITIGGGLGAGRSLSDARAVGCVCWVDALRLSGIRSTVRCMRALLVAERDDAELNEEQQQADIDRQRQRKAGRSPLEAAPGRGARRAVCGQELGIIGRVGRA